MKKLKLVTILAFISTIFFFSWKTFTSEKQLRSEMEGRRLAEQPKFSFSGYLDKSYNNDFEVFFQDHFYKRIGLSKRYIQLEKALGRNEIKGTIIGTNDELFYTPIRSELETNQFVDELTNQLNLFVDSIERKNIPLYLYLLPSKTNTMRELYNETSLDRFYNEKLNTMEEWINPYINFFDVGKSWLSKYDIKTISEFFYKTDHHWNGKGAYEGYSEIIAYLNATGVNVGEAFKKSELNNRCASEDAFFSGSHNRVILYNVNHANEYICNWEIPDFSIYDKIVYRSLQGERLEGPGMFAPGANKSKITYAGLTTSDHSYVYIKNAKPNNDIKALIIRDSYTNAITSTLPAHFNETYLLDMRHFHSDLNELIEEKEINLILLLHNSVSINSEVTTYFE